MLILFLERLKEWRQQRKLNKSKSSDSSLISTAYIEDIVEKLSMEKHRDSTRETYHCIWKQFNKFFIRLDAKPCNWEDRLVLFTAYLVENKLKSSSIKSYISAIRSVLAELV